MGLYDADFHKWLLAQADAIRRRSANELDWENLAEEVESLGRSEGRSLDSHLGLIISHLLKWEHQPIRRGWSWKRTVMNNRSVVPLILRNSPSLKATLEEAFLSAYEWGRMEAAHDMGVEIEDLPVDPPFSLEQVLDSRFPQSLADWEPGPRARRRR